MYRRTPDKNPPPGYGGTAFLRTEWPPPVHEVPRKLRESSGTFVPFAPAPPETVAEPVPEAQPVHDVSPAPTPPPAHLPSLPSEETLLLLGVFLLLTESDLLLALAVLFLL